MWVNVNLNCNHYSFVLLSFPATGANKSFQEPLDDKSSDSNGSVTPNSDINHDTLTNGKPRMKPSQTTEEKSLYGGRWVMILFTFLLTLILVVVYVLHVLGWIFHLVEQIKDIDVLCKWCSVIEVPICM